MKGKGSKASREEDNSFIQLDASLLSPQWEGADQGTILMGGGLSILKLKPAGYHVVQHECVYVGGGGLKSDVTLCEPKHRSVTALFDDKGKGDPVRKKEKDAKEKSKV